MSTTIRRDYLEDPLNVWPLDTAIGETITASQFQAVINKTSAPAVQFLGSLTQSGAQAVQLEGVIDALAARGAQFTAQRDEIIARGFQFNGDTSQKNPLGTQFSGEVYTTPSNAAQFTAEPLGIVVAATQFHGFMTQPWSLGSQYESFVVDYRKALASNFRTNTIFHQADLAYLVEDYLTTPYLSSRILAIMSSQFEAIVDKRTSVGTQYLAELDSNKVGATQFIGVLNATEAVGTQFKGDIVDFLKATGTQFEGRIDTLKGGAFQFEGSIVDWLKAFGAQFTGYVVTAMGTQFRSALYNTTNLRVLCDFPSRGTSGVNWTASHTAPGDYGVNNLNTDIVEQIWRSPDTVKTAVTLTCDTGVPQGVYMDTLALLNHNLTTSAQVEVTGANAPDFSGVVKTFFMRQSTENSYWVAPELPLEGYRYWRFVINDGTNPAAFLSIGTIVFGESIMLHQEQFADPIRYKKTHYSDRVETEGFTAAQNDRGIKRSLALDFRSLNATGGNYENLQDVFQYARTNLKCLWIPTPQYPGRYAVFAKLTQLPDETHVDHGENADYVDFSIEMDEAR